MPLPVPCLICSRLCVGGYCPEHAPVRRAGSTRAWRRLRRDVLKRAGARCERCGQPARQVHHLEPVFITGRADNENPARLIALCDDCHRAAHSYRDQLR